MGHSRSTKGCGALLSEWFCAGFLAFGTLATQSKLFHFLPEHIQLRGKCGLFFIAQSSCDFPGQKMMGSCSHPSFQSGGWQNGGA